jgi:signal transduction histidine kinase
MTKKSFVLSGESVTWFRNKLRADPFFSARYKILGLYFIIGAAMFVGMGYISDYTLHQEVYHIALSQNGAPVRAAFMGLRQDLWKERLTLVLLFACAAFLITEFVLRPIRKSAEIQRRFVAIVSHELRTPLTIMKNTAEIGLRSRDTLSLEKAVGIIESNLEETNRISDTISFLLAFSVLGERSQTVASQHVSLEAITREVLASIEKRYPEKGVGIDFAASPVPDIRGDAVALKVLVFNLIENAVLHTPQGSGVTVSLSTQGKRIVLSVSDSGPGIAKKDLPYIFQPFYRGSRTTTEETPRTGMGLGLSLVKEIAEFHRASVHVSSVLEKGSIFTVTFRA